jgi:uncharacterized protein YcfJ
MRILSNVLIVAAMALTSSMAAAQPYPYNDDNYQGNSDQYGQVGDGTVTGVWPVGADGIQISSVCQRVGENDNRNSYTYDRYSNSVAASYRVATRYDNSPFDDNQPAAAWTKYYQNNSYGGENSNAQPRDPSRIVGKLLGATAGGAIGHQVGHGRGKRAATIIGAIFGGIIGNKIERDEQQEQYYGHSNVNNSYTDSHGSDHTSGAMLRCHNEVEPTGELVGYAVHYNVQGRTYMARYNQAPRVGSLVRPERGARLID